MGVVLDVAAWRDQHALERQREDVQHRRACLFDTGEIAPDPVVLDASNWAMSSPSFVVERKEIWCTDGAW